MTVTPSGRIATVLIIGNDVLSHSIVRALSAQPAQYDIIILTQPYQSSTTSTSQAKHITSDFSPASLRAAFSTHKPDLVVSTTHGGDYDLQIRIISAAVASGVKRFIPHEFGHDTLNPGVQERLPPSKERARVLRYLKAMQKDGTISATEKGTDEHVDVKHAPGYDAPFEWTGIACGCLLDAGLIDGSLGFDIKWNSATIHGAGTEQFAASSSIRVGEVVRKVIEHWDEVKDQYLYAHGCITSANQVLRALEKSTGKTWEAGRTSVQECLSEARKSSQRGFRSAAAVLFERSVLYDEDVADVKAFKNSSHNELLGLEKERVLDIVVQAVHDFNHLGKPDCGCA